MGGSLGGGGACGTLVAGGACGALVAGGACGALVAGGVGETLKESEAWGAGGRCAANEDGAWGAKDVVSLPHRKTYHTQRNMLTNRFLDVS